MSKLPELLTRIAILGSLTVYVSSGEVISRSIGHGVSPTVPEGSTPVYFVLKSEEGSLIAVAQLCQVKLFCRDIMNRNLEDASFRHQFSESEFSTMAIGIQRQYRAPFVLKITTGLNDIDGKNDMATASQHLTATEGSARMWAMTIYDYLYAWEIVCWRRIQDANTVYAADIIGQSMPKAPEGDVFA